MLKCFHLSTRILWVNTVPSDCRACRVFLKQSQTLTSNQQPQSLETPIDTQRFAPAQTVVHRPMFGTSITGSSPLGPVWIITLGTSIHPGDFNKYGSVQKILWTCLEHCWKWSNLERKIKGHQGEIRNALPLTCNEKHEEYLQLKLDPTTQYWYCSMALTKNNSYFHGCNNWSQILGQIHGHWCHHATRKCHLGIT